ncbi:sensor histidine kinase [Pontimicrobium aquaticum]|uniref:histidine kinase n=1 Tax=Pontimicrobium aquaticum TaxID=2565367 RepID=A0A4U0F2M7_9FLAO|nr:ATP-binding protein [Pontimicrobium aquaticum]TJY36952.1 two-component sensor histidine kinase [Pontimicrobium aquaticum]
MNDKRYQWVLYVIVVVIISTIAIQVYWNFNNYKSNEQQLVNDVQASLDNAIEKYYTNLAKEKTYGFAFRTSLNGDSLLQSKSIDSVMHYIDLAKSNITNIDSFDIESGDAVKIYKGINMDSVFININESFPSRRSIHNVLSDSIIEKEMGFEMLTSKVLISLTSDSLQLQKIDSIFKVEIATKSIDISYKLDLSFNDTLLDSTSNKLIDSSDLVTFSKSPFLPPHSNLYVGFSNSTKEILKRILTGILISTLLVLAVISCLFYLLKIIKHQKQLAEVKNDFISNITHEFKTPIATIGVALESIKDFNVINDKEKTQSYLNISSNQLSKLNTMVEKLLETASLDSENLQLKKEQTNVTNLAQNLINKHRLELKEKSLTFNHPKNDIIANIDPFHFENALNNIIDNAIKYGGKNIEVSLNKNTICFTVSINDNGKELNKESKDKIFEKFYRVPKGNTHNVKGYGIGLYYAKKIIEKHDGIVFLDLDNKWTSFKISIPNGKA